MRPAPRFCHCGCRFPARSAGYSVYETSRARTKASVGGSVVFVTNFRLRNPRSVLHYRMANILTIRISPVEMAKMDRRAAQLGRDRSGYVRSLIEQDLKAAPIPRKHVFASED